ncbi:DASH family cryptochrome [Aeromonas veronii]|uniref:DASH family cryptochrome n=1 Tax=Aeromonas veronii TaxID=654 RepID=UPI0038E66670
MNTIGLFMFDHDLRVLDNPALSMLAKNVDRLICVYIQKPQSDFSKRFSQTHPSAAQIGYLQQTLSELAANLQSLNQSLRIEQGDVATVISRYIKQHGITHVGRTVHAGFNEQQQWRYLKTTFPAVDFSAHSGSSLFLLADLPFKLADLPATFSPCRKRLEQLDIPQPFAAVSHLPPSPITAEYLPQRPAPAAFNRYYAGGETSGQTYLAHYFASPAPAVYKETRNALMGDDFSTKLSGFLAHGALSPRQIMAALQQYEYIHGANESTYWIYVELLWREYFYWYARKHQQRLFSAGGVMQKSLMTCFYPSRFKQWCHGSTPYPLVNALMHELNETGWMSNRGRQIVASCLVNELKLDWRYGAAYFEQRLIDYDVASNWGNWQYLAGVGPDPQGGRHFDIKKQTGLYDPQRAFITHWWGDKDCQPIDHTDMVDWPVGGQWP